MEPVYKYRTNLRKAFFAIFVCSLVALGMRRMLMCGSIAGPVLLGIIGLPTVFGALFEGFRGASIGIFAGLVVAAIGVMLLAGLLYLLFVLAGPVW